MAFKILLNVCCEKTELNTSKQNLRYEMDTGMIINSDTEQPARCFNCGQKISGDIYVECGISNYTGTIKTQNELVRELVRNEGPIQLDCSPYEEDKTGMSE